METEVLYSDLPDQQHQTALPYQTYPAQQKKEELMIATHLKPLYPVKLITDKNAHFYEIDGNPDWKPGVTTALGMINKPALVPWAANVACENIKDYLLANALGRPLTKEEIDKACIEGKNIYKKKAQEAADIGTRVHQAIDALIRGEPKYETADIVAGVQGFLDWKASNSLKIELGDTKLGSKLFGYGGSLDMVAFEGEEPIIFDFKTTKKRKDRNHGIYDEYAYQLAAYVQAFRETYGLEVKKVYALWLNKEKPEFKAVKISNIQEALGGFLAALKLYKLSKFNLFEEDRWDFQTT